MKFSTVYGILIILALVALIAFREYSEYLSSPAKRMQDRLDSVMTGERDSSALKQPCGSLLFVLERAVDSLSVLRSIDSTAAIARLGSLHVEIAECDPANTMEVVLAFSYLCHTRDYRRCLKLWERQPQAVLQKESEYETILIALLEAVGDSNTAMSRLHRSYEQAREFVDTANDVDAVNDLYATAVKAEDRYHMNGERASIKEQILRLHRRRLQELNLTDAEINRTIATTRGLTVEKIDRIILRPSPLGLRMFILAI